MRTEGGGESSTREGRGGEGRARKGRDWRSDEGRGDAARQREGGRDWGPHLYCPKHDATTLRGRVARGQRILAAIRQ